MPTDLNRVARHHGTVAAPLHLNLRRNGMLLEAVGFPANSKQDHLLLHSRLVCMKPA